MDRFDVRKAREKLGISRDRLAALTGLSLVTLYRIERKKTAARYNTLRRIREALAAQQLASTGEDDG